MPQFINAMEAAQRKSKRAKLVINDEYLHAVALKLLLKSGEHETETREWSKLPDANQNWEDWKTTFHAEYVAKRRSEAKRGFPVLPGLVGLWEFRPLPGFCFVFSRLQERF